MRVASWIVKRAATLLLQLVTFIALSIVLNLALFAIMSRWPEFFRPATDRVGIDLCAPVSHLRKALSSKDKGSVNKAYAELAASLLPEKGDDLALLWNLWNQEMLVRYPGTAFLTCIGPDGKQTSGCVFTETSVGWANLPPGENKPRFCVTDSSGTCEIRHLPLNEPLRFKLEKEGLPPQTEIQMTLSANMPAVAWDARPPQ